MLPWDRQRIRRKNMAGKKKNDSFKVGRDAKTGEFISVEAAKRRPATSTVETIKKPTSKKK